MVKKHIDLKDQISPSRPTKKERGRKDQANVSCVDFYGSSEKTLLFLILPSKDSVSFHTLLFSLLFNKLTKKKSQHNKISSNSSIPVIRLSVFI